MKTGSAPLRVVGAGAVALAFVVFSYTMRQTGHMVPVPFLILYAMTSASAAIWGSAVGLTVGLVAAGYALLSHFTGWAPGPMTNTLAASVVSATLYALSGYLIGRLKDENDANRAKLERLVSERTHRLEDSEERFQHAVRTVSDGIWDWDFRTGKIYVSRRLSEMLGYSQEELGQDFDSLAGLIAEEDREEARKAFEACAAGKRNRFEMQMRIQHGSGDMITVLSRGTVVFRDGEPSRLIGSTLDISDKIRIMEMLEMTEEMLYEGIQALPVGFAFFDADDKLVLFNESYQRHLQGHGGSLLKNGLKFEQLIRATAFDAARDLGFDNAESYVNARVAASRDNRAPWLYESRDGRSIRMVEFPTNSGGFISLITDVTDERRSEMRVRQAQRLEVIGQLTGGIAHDFNNVLAVIQGCADLLQVSASAEKALVEQMLHAVHRGSDLTHRLLAYARRQPLAPTSIDCSALIGGMQDVLTRTLGERIDVTVSAPPGTWWAHADPGQVEDMLMNLALNARDAMPEGGRLSISCANCTHGLDGATQRPEMVPGEYVKLTVSDSGTGMSPQVLDKAVEPFFTTKPFGQGSGLGLSMVYGFVRQSGGHISIDSEPGRGTAVDVFLPRGSKPRTPVPKGPADTIPMGRGETVLVVEDDALVRDLVLRTLEGLGYAATAVEDADAAQRLIGQGQSFDLVLTDVVLPGGISGPEFASGLGSILPPSRIVFMSGYPDTDPAGDGIDQDIHKMLPKPFQRKDLAIAMRAALQSTQRGDPVAQPADRIGASAID